MIIYIIGFTFILLASLAMLYILIDIKQEEERLHISSKQGTQSALRHFYGVEETNKKKKGK